MSDPRLNGSHLDVARHDQYEATIDEILDDRGPITSDADPLVRLPKLVRPPTTASTPDGTFILVSLPDGRRYDLRVGINAIGRSRANDLVFREHWISRRHCVIVVHASGQCELYDTVSRNGTWVNEDRIGRADLIPGDILTICHKHLLVAWIGQDGQMVPDAVLGELTSGDEIRAITKRPTDRSV